MSRRAQRVLVVEDDEIDVANVRRAFRKAGLPCPLGVAGDGRQALDLLRAGARTVEMGEPLPGLVLLDLNLPRMSGLELLRELKCDPDLSEIPVIVLTSSDHERDVRAAYRGGAAAYIVKPIELASFVRAIAAIGRFWDLAAVR